MPIDQNKIVDAVVAMNPHGNEEGIIDAFGVYLTNHYADYYNRISFNFEKELVAKTPENSEMLSGLLLEAGHVCAFYTFGGIYRSDAWKGLIEPMCKTKEDKVRGLIAVANALGWGVWQVKSVSEKKLVLQTKNSYESIGYLKEFEKSKHGECYLLTGGAAGIMNIIYNDKVYEDGTGVGVYHGKETKCRCKGDKYCEVIVEKI